jgi:hypothetical protein
MMSAKFGGWAIDEAVYSYIIENVPTGSTMIELGSGLGSTPALGAKYTLYSIEQNVEFVGKFDCTTYISAPLVNGWYNRANVKAGLPVEYDAILIDGPIGTNRVNFVNNLDLFNLDVLIVVDDSQRAPEQELVKVLQQHGKKIIHTHDGGGKSFCVLK